LVESSTAEQSLFERCGLVAEHDAGYSKPAPVGGFGFKRS
jgi:hypothetical protein